MNSNITLEVEERAKKFQADTMKQFGCDQSKEITLTVGEIVNLMTFSFKSGVYTVLDYMGDKIIENWTIK